MVARFAEALLAFRKLLVHRLPQRERRRFIPRPGVLERLDLRLGLRAVLGEQTL
jgi:hypothetical protein